MKAKTHKIEIWERITEQNFQIKQYKALLEFEEKNHEKSMKEKDKEIKKLILEMEDFKIENRALKDKILEITKK